MAEPMPGEAEHALGFFEIVPEKAQHCLKRYRLIDVREPHEFDGPLHHIEGAELVPLGGLVEAAKDWDREKPLLLICRSGNRSGRAAEALMDEGFAHCTNMVGGMIRWNDAKLPTA